MVIFSTQIVGNFEHILGFNNDGYAYVWNLKNVFQYSLPIYKSIQSIRVPDKFVFKTIPIDKHLALCSHNAVSIVKTYPLKLESILNIESIAKYTFSAIDRSYTLLALGFSHGSLATYDLNKQCYSMETKQKSMITATLIHENLLISGDNKGNLLQIDMRCPYTVRYLSTVDSTIVDIQFARDNLYVCHEDFISKWNIDVGECIGYIEVGMDCQAMKATQKEILVGGNSGYLYGIDEVNSTHRRRDVTTSCIFSINQQQNYTIVSGVGSIIDIMSYVMRVCSLVC